MRVIEELLGRRFRVIALLCLVSLMGLSASSCEGATEAGSIEFRFTWEDEPSEPVWLWVSVEERT